MYSLNKLKSHSNKLLYIHLKNVGNLSKKTIESKKINISEFLDFEILKEITYLIGITHDFGKATDYFQKYINEEDEKIKLKLKNKPETHHAFLSALFAYYVIKNYLSRKDLIEKKCYKYLPIISFLVVKRHHGNLGNAKDETYFNDNDEENIKKQIDAISFNRLNGFYQKLYTNYKINISDFKDKYKEIMSEINSGINGQRKLIIRLDEESNPFYYFISLLLYSVLLDSDKKDAAELISIERKGISYNIVDDYKKLKFGESKSKINIIRNKIYSEVISSVNKLNLCNDKILSLNVPTGTGKTLTSLSFALKLRHRLEKEEGFSPRIIYSLPFLSIIDQNSDVFNEVLDNPTTDMLLKHHHLSDIVYTTENEFENTELEKDINKSLLLIEGWNSEIIVTTFMQFFYSFITNKNRAIRKFHNITNSIIILDEVQSIPHKYWLMLNETIKFFANCFNTYFIFVTATQPLIFDEEKSEIKSLVKNKKEYFEEVNRYDLITKLEPMSIENFKVELKEDISQHPKKDFLIVMNTIESSKEIYGFIKNEINDNKESKTYYLSTNIIPKERLNKIKEIKKKTKERRIIISTQLIEAGVDIDVNIVYRDFAPFDSINQVAGRCNRNFGKNKGIVKIVILKENEDRKEYFKYIYGNFITNKTQMIFREIDNQNCPISEMKILELNNSYFEKVKNGMSNDESKKILEYVKKLEFAELAEFKLIENQDYKVDVFIEFDDNAKMIMERYVEILKNTGLKSYERKLAFAKIKNIFYSYVIFVNKKNIESNYLPTISQEFELPFDIDMYYVSNSNLKNNYDTKIGFITKNCNFL